MLIGVCARLRAADEDVVHGRLGLRGHEELTNTTQG